MLEEQQYNSSAEHTTTTNVWGQQGVNDLVEKDIKPISGSTAHYYAQHDANFDVTALISSGGSVLERYEYDPYGNITVLNSNFTTKGASDYGMQELFQGMRYDPNSGLYNAKFRNYSATSGTWMQEEPIGYWSGNNLYQADQSNPVHYLDPSGLATSTSQVPSGPKQSTQQWVTVSYGWVVQGNECLLVLHRELVQTSTQTINDYEWVPTERSFGHGLKVAGDGLLVTGGASAVGALIPSPASPFLAGGALACGLVGSLDIWIGTDLLEDRYVPAHWQLTGTHLETTTEILADNWTILGSV